MKNILIYLIFAVVFFSCSESRINDLVNTYVKEVYEFPQSISIRSTPVDIKAIGLHKLFVVDTFLLAFNFSSNDYFINVFSKYSLKKLGVIAPKGRGPLEFITIGFSGQYEKDSTGCYIWVNDVNQSNKCLKINLTESLKRGEMIVSDKFSTSHNTNPSFIMFLKDSLVAAFPFYQIEMPNISGIIYKRGSEIKLISEKKLYQNNISQKDLSKNWFLAYEVNPARTRIVAYGNEFNRFHILSPLLDTIKTVVVDKKYTPNKPDLPDEFSRRCYYYDAVVTNEYVCLLCVNKEINEILKGNSGFGCSIQVFKLNGEPVCEYYLEENLWDIDIDRQTGIVYGTCSDETVFKYDLSNLNI